MKRAVLFLFAFIAIGAACFLAGVFVATHHPQWAAFLKPSASEPAGADGRGHGEFCAEHGVPERFCTICDPERAKGLDMCAEHGLAEEICPLCHPESAAKHGVKQLCAPHGLPTAFCRECRGGGDLPLVRLKSPSAAEKAGIETAPIEERSAAETVEGLAEISFDQSRTAIVRAQVKGLVTSTLVREGEAVDKGQELAVIESVELAEAKAEHLAAQAEIELARATLERQKALAEGSVASQQTVEQAIAGLKRAEASLLKAGQKLKAFGLTEDGIARLRDEGAAQRSRLTLRAPLKGIVVRRRAAEGELVAGDAELFAVSDIAHVWARIDVPESAAARVRVGQPVRFHADSAGGEFEGRVIGVESEVDPRTRAVPTRAEIQNRDGLLRARTFGRATIDVAPARTSLWIPTGALQWEKSSHVVFVDRGSGIYEPRRVKAEVARGGAARMTEGALTVGERVVTQGSFLLKTEILRGEIGAGCCGE